MRVVQGLCLLVTVSGFVVEAFVANGLGEARAHRIVGVPSDLRAPSVRPFSSRAVVYQQTQSQTASLPKTQQQNLLDQLRIPSFGFHKQTQSLRSTCERVARGAQRSLGHVQSLITESWWMLPMTLCLVPLICKYILHIDAATPSFWKMVDMQFVHKLPHSAATIAAFLFSNIAYFVSGFYLLFKSTAKSIKTTTIGRLTNLQTIPQLALWRGPWSKTYALGYWILAAGLISTLFHSVQALGDYTVAESWCYLDHGVACSASLYFWKVCGPPARRTLALGIPGLVCLAVTPQPAYTWLHSMWHLLSAGAAVAWALQAFSKEERRDQLEMTYWHSGAKRLRDDDLP